MPAIQPARLKIQAVRLTDDFTQPAAFISKLDDILDFYADRTHRSGLAGTPHPLLNAYNVPAPVMRQLLAELAPLVINHPQAGLDLADGLWQRENLECRLIAASLLGVAPREYADEVVSRVQIWLQTETERRLIEALVRQGLELIRKDVPAKYLALLETWLASPDLSQQEIGLLGMLPLLENDSFSNLPVLFRLLTPYIRVVHTYLRPALLSVLDALAERSPQETAYLLRQNLYTPDNSDTAWVIRKMLRRFPQEIRDSLRKSMSSP